MHAGVVEDMSNTLFSHNGAGNEGPAILSLGILNAMTSVTFLENGFYCAAGKYSADSPTVRAHEREKEGEGRGSYLRRVGFGGSRALHPAVRLHWGNVCSSQGGYTNSIAQFTCAR